MPFTAVQHGVCYCENKMHRGLAAAFVCLITPYSIDTLCSQIDVPPTLFDLMGWSYRFKVLWPQHP